MQNKLSFETNNEIEFKLFLIFSFQALTGPGHHDLGKSWRNAEQLFTSDSSCNESKNDIFFCETLTNKTDKICS